MDSDTPRDTTSDGTTNPSGSTSSTSSKHTSTPKDPTGSNTSGQGGGDKSPLGGGTSGGMAGGGGCGELDGTSMKLPGTGNEYCVKAHPDCLDAKASCPLYITLNTNGAYFDRVDDASANGTFITVESRQTFDGKGVKDPLAELPRVLAVDYPGLDAQRIYLVGWSAGAGGVARGMCQASKDFDKSTYGTTSDVYAAIATLGGCPKCGDDFKPIAGKWHVFATNGLDDQFGGQGCADSLLRFAKANGCSDLGASWCAVPPGDEHVAAAPGKASVAEKISFGTCPGGDVVGYRFGGEGHVVSYKKNFDPKVRAYDMVWEFLQGRTKGDGGKEGSESACK